MCTLLVPIRLAQTCEKSRNINTVRFVLYGKYLLNIYLNTIHCLSKTIRDDQQYLPFECTPLVNFVKIDSQI